MSHSIARRPSRWLGLLGTLVLVGAVAGMGGRRPVPAPTAPRDTVAAESSSSLARPAALRFAPALDDSLYGRSGKLYARLVSTSRPATISLLTRFFGDTVLARPAVYPVDAEAADRPFSLITLLPFAAKTAGKIGTYRLGQWPAELRPARSPAYANPDGFIQVTPENQDTRVSEHFRLRDFLTKDQQAVWPKYLVLREELIDKLELIITDLNAHGVAVEHMTVMSGFRTPQYNEQGVGAGGRVADSRHQYGDAADVFVDNNGNGNMDDLNRDGRIDQRDAQVILDAEERVERALPELVGGGGLYVATAAHGPFAHIDVRGNRARW